VNFTAIVSALSMWLVRVGLSFVLCRMLGVGLEGVWYAWFTDWVVRLCFYVYRYRSGKWLEKRVL
jgi:Na+-driven multidrug efflux pump